MTEPPRKELWVAVEMTKYVRGVFRAKDAAGDCAREHADVSMGIVLDELPFEEQDAAMAEHMERDVFTEGLPLPYGEGLDFAVRADVADDVNTAPGNDVWTVVEQTTTSAPDNTCAGVIPGTRIIICSTQQAAEARARAPPAGWKSCDRVAKRVVDKQISMF